MDNDRSLDDRFLAVMCTVYRLTRHVLYGIAKPWATREDLFPRNRTWDAGRISGDKGIYRQLIAITSKTLRRSGSYFLPGRCVATKHFYDNAVLRQLGKNHNFPECDF